jgi:ketosteroid isomerase-like protein
MSGGLGAVRPSGVEANSPVDRFRQSGDAHETSPASSVARGALYGAPMAGDAYDTIKRFWDIQDHGDYAALAPLFADDAEVVDPVYGTFVGGEAIAGFFTMMNTEMAKAGASFRLVELAGDNETAWAQWEATTNKGVRQGVGVYRVRNGQLTYYKDYMNP